MSKIRSIYKTFSILDRDWETGIYDPAEQERKMHMDNQKDIKSRWMKLEAQALRHKAHESRKQDPIQKGSYTAIHMESMDPSQESFYNVDMAISRLEKIKEDAHDDMDEDAVDVIDFHNRGTALRVVVAKSALDELIFPEKEELSKPKKKDEDPVEHYIRLWKEGKPLSSGEKIVSRDQAIAIGIAEKNK